MSDLRSRIARFLGDYRLQRVVIDDSAGDHLPLVDALSGDGDIGAGKAEIDALAEALVEEIEGAMADPTPAPDLDPSPVRELAEEIAGDKYPTAGRGDKRLGVCARHWEGKLAALLAERERGWAERVDRSATLGLQMAGRMAAMRGALEALVFGVQELYETHRAAEGPVSPQPALYELAAEAKAALAPGAGEAAGRVLAAVKRFQQGVPHSPGDVGDFVREILGLADECFGFPPEKPRSVRAASRRYEMGVHPGDIGGGRPREGEG